MFSLHKSGKEGNGELNSAGSDPLQSMSFSSNVTDDVMRDDAGQQDTKDEQDSNVMSKEATTDQLNQRDKQEPRPATPPNSPTDNMVSLTLEEPTNSTTNCAEFNWLCLVCWLTSMILSCLTIVIGTVYLTECAIEPRIPVLLIVCGALQLLYTFVGLAELLDLVPVQLRFATTVVDTLIGLCGIATWIATMVLVIFVFSTVNVEDETSESYCHPLMYAFGCSYPIIYFTAAVVTCVRFFWQM